MHQRHHDLLNRFVFRFVLSAPFPQVPRTWWSSPSSIQLLMEGAELLKVPLVTVAVTWPRHSGRVATESPREVKKLPLGLQLELQLATST